MKIIRSILYGAGLVLSLSFVHAQQTVSSAETSASDLDVMLQALEATTPIPASDLPEETHGFYSVQNPEWPPFPGDVLNLNVWPLGDGLFALDDRNINYNKTVKSQAIIQSNEIMQPMDDGPPAPPGGGGTNSDGGVSLSLQAFTTNDLWLQIIAFTNNTASLVIHPPWNMANSVWGLYFTTNVATPLADWTWLLRNVPQQTNLVVTNLLAAQGFFILGPPTAIRSGFDQQSLGPNDDDSYFTSGFDPYYLITNLLATVGFPINFFGTTYTNLWVNNNGNTTFGNFLPDYTPTNLVSLGTNIIAPFWADVDTRGTNSGVVTYGTNMVDGHLAFGVNWINVGYYLEEDDKSNSFQMIIIDRSDRTNGDFDLEFNYAQIQWEAGDVSGGCDGLWNNGFDCEGDYYDPASPARAGFASASGSTFELNGSGIAGSFLDTNKVTGLIYTNFNSTVPGRYVFQFHDGVPLATP